MSVTEHKPDTLCKHKPYGLTSRVEYLCRYSTQTT